MQTLVICIDRDNDIGEKAGIKTPVIGRENNIEAAVKLATVDPEDSDTNTIFGGIKVLDDLRKRGVDAEIVSLAGDKNVGVISDQNISRQLDELLLEFDVKSSIFISDGAEDETLVPIVQSRVKIDSVQRIVVMQSANLESTYYILKHAFSDPKISQTFFVPIGLAAIIYSLSLLANYPEGAIVGILIAVGIYMLYRGFMLDDKLALFFDQMKSSIHSGKITFITYLSAVLVGIIATVQGVVSVWAYYVEGGIWYYGTLTLFTLFINSSVIWYVLAGLVANTGKVIDRYVNGLPVKKSVSHAFFITSVGSLLWGASMYLLSITLDGEFVITPESGIQYFVYSIILAFILSLIGIKISLDTIRKNRMFE
ncbi:Protein of unknown function DUF373 [Methanosalsum zhilinae DSM 4017]|uniref:DUF373 family protein n=1 Tax=Methanosalsum zhilinae (strain DSM 4017 / NBRC 107636 / OCM 62 / WeN5) TaxID=679901 RepID=F7XKP9_METZD|nr:DUF373 family protein [Methanosalsum zhilinae]AEH60660.1 Protein of unknown function DUF373 [Methanosalsum zhilinae DSM 4017]